MYNILLTLMYITLISNGYANLVLILNAVIILATISSEHIWWNNIKYYFIRTWYNITECTLEGNEVFIYKLNYWTRVLGFYKYSRSRMLSFTFSTKMCPEILKNRA